MKERRPFRPRRGRLGHLPQGGRQASAPSLPLGRQAEGPLLPPRGGSGRRPIGGSPSRKAGHRNSFLGRRPFILPHFFSPLLPPAFAAAGSWHQPHALGLRRRLRTAGGADPLPHRLEATQLLPQFPIPCVFRMIHPLFLLCQPMRALAKRCELCHNISYENVGFHERF